MAYDIELTPGNPYFKLLSSYGLPISIPEGLTDSFTLFQINSDNIKEGDLIPFEVTGVSIDDLITQGTGITVNEKGVITGLAYGVTKGIANVPIRIKADYLTEGTETLVVHVGNSSASVRIADTSRELKNVFFIPGDHLRTYQEGQSIEILIETSNLSDGATIPYSLSGLSKADVTNGILSGFLTNQVDPTAYGRRAIDGSAHIEIPLATNHTVGDTRLVTLTVKDEWIQFIVVDDLRYHPPLLEPSQSSPVDDAVGVNPENGITLTFSTPIDSSKSDLTKVYLRNKASESIVPSSAFVDSYGRLVITPKTSLSYNSQYYVNYGADVLKDAMGNGVAALAGKSTYDFQTMAEPPIYSLSANISGANEGDTVVFTLATSHLAAGASISYVLSKVDAADVWPTQTAGKLIVGTDGRAVLKVPIVEDFLTEGQELLVFTAGGETCGVFINDSSLTPIKPVPPTYELYTVNSSGEEGGTLIFTLQTTNVLSGTQINYALTGVDASDVWPAQLTGQVAVGVNGQAVLSVTIAADFITEGQENLVLTMAGKTCTVPIFDTVQPATYALSSSISSVNEGGSVQFTVTTKNVKAGERVIYSITGETGDITLNDFSPKQLSGDLSVDSNGLATVSVGIATDQLTEGTEAFIFTAANNSTRVSINDISRNFVINPSVNSVADEKFTATAGQKSTTVPLDVSQGTLTKNAATGEWLLASSQLGTDNYVGFKRLVFNDKTVALDFEKGQPSYNAAMIIGAAFGKAFVNQYFAIGVSLFDNQQSMGAVCDLIVRSGLMEVAVGNSNAAWVDQVYENVVGVKPDPLSSFVYTNYLDTGVYSKSSLLELAVGVSALESQVGLVGLQSHGLAYTAFG